MGQREIVVFENSAIFLRKKSKHECDKETVPKNAKILPEFFIERFLQRKRPPIGRTSNLVNDLWTSKCDRLAKQKDSDECGSAFFNGRAVKNLQLAASSAVV
jgi:hypothetical protein